MGIPSYFSYLVKNHIEIMRKFNRDSFPLGVDHLYMDCNSVIYDVVRTMQCRDTKDICRNVVTKIEEYISIVAPKKRVIIAFDGVAPVAKLEQQRNRRYKSWYTSNVARSLFPEKRDVWNTTMITPGTLFMKELNEFVRHHFSNKSTSNRLQVPCLVSTSFEYGEGEHKIFQYIRKHPKEHAEATTVVYGLDADLIMLSINHLPICPQIFLFRETPEFIASIDASLEPLEQYVLDIPLLSQEIMNHMSSSSTNSSTLVHDYIFLCFFLGNDFMPHFPAVNIRTGGVDKMMNAYKATLGPNDCLTDGKRIYWNQVRKVVQWLANAEQEMLKKETALRDRREKTRYPQETGEQKFKRFDATPTFERDVEKFIDPFKPGWQERYYRALFQPDFILQDVVKNYVEGLEWTLKYYTTDCPDWKWKYKYHYPPLLQDLVTWMPYFEKEMVAWKPDDPVDPLVQLCYVMPHNSLQFLPSCLEQKLKREYSHWYPLQCEFVWAYCKYFWESHVELPEIDLDLLKQIIQETKY
jgi:5'-3' exonuclease